MIPAFGVPLTRKGKNFFACCPFHEGDKDPSFVVSPDKQIFKCFGCNKGGDIFRFVMYYENIDFVNAFNRVIEVSNLSDTYKMQVKKEPIYVPYSTEQNEIYTMNKRIQEYADYYGSFPENGVIDYLKNRYINDDDRKSWHFGYIPDINELVVFLQKKYKYSVEDLLKNEFFYLTQNNKIISKFENRLLMPICDNYNSICGFVSRKINDKCRMDAKYINSEENKCFQKGDILYNYNNAKDSIRKLKHVFLVEGYFDAIALSKIQPNVCALMGVSLTENHIRLLRSIDSNLHITLMLDQDRAGRDGTIRIFDKLSEENFNIDAVWYKNAKDPDELYQNGLLNSDALNIISPFEYRLNMMAESTLTSIQFRKELDELLRIAISCDSAIDCEYNLLLASKYTGISIDSLKHDAYKNMPKKNPILDSAAPSKRTFSNVMKNKRRVLP